MHDFLGILNGFQGGTLPKKLARFYMETDTYLYIGIGASLQNLYDLQRRAWDDATTVTLSFNTDGLPTASKSNLKKIY